MSPEQAKIVLEAIFLSVVSAGSGAALIACLRRLRRYRRIRLLVQPMGADEVIALLKDPARIPEDLRDDPGVPVEAISSLEGRGDARALEALVAALGSPSADLRKYAASELSEITGQRFRRADDEGAPDASAYARWLGENRARIRFDERERRFCVQDDPDAGR